MFGKEKSQYIEDSKFRYTMREMKKNGSAYILALPYFLLFLIFTGIPVVISLPVGFTNFNMVQFPQWVGLSNFYTLFLQDDVFLIAIQNTLVFAIITGPVSYVLCFVFAWLINELRPKVRAVVTLIFYAPVLSGTAFTVWSFIFSSDQYGLLNGYLMELGILSFFAGLLGVVRTLYEAGLVDGVHNRFQELWYITLPVMKPQLLFGAVMQIVSSFSVADVSVRLAGFPSTQYAAETLVTHIMDYGTARPAMGYACALACFLFALMYLANKLVTFALGRVGT